MPELRKDPVLGRWVVIATERARRPSDFKGPGDNRQREAESCPFCRGNEDATPPEVLRIPAGAADWQIRVVPNRFPALSAEGEPSRRGVGIYDLIEGFGVHEVIVETPDHGPGLAELGPSGLVSVVDCWRVRALGLAEDPRLRYVLVFKNHGAVAGASLAHSHSQLIATPVVPVLVREELKGAEQYFTFRRRCIYCDILKQELADNTRVVCTNAHFVALCPFAPRFPFEVWVIPRGHFGSYDALSPELTMSLAELLSRLLGSIKRLLSDPPYNLVIHSAPTVESALAHYHFHIEIMPKLSKIAGFEVGSGFYINPMAPESAASHLRRALACT